MSTEKKVKETEQLQMLKSKEISLSEQRIAEEMGYKASQVAVARRTVAKKTTLTELAFFLEVAKSQGLNPFNKEVWCYKDYRENLIIFAGRDGMLRKAQENPNFAGIRSSEVRENDEYIADIPNGKIHHKITSMSNKDRGKIVGAYCFVFRKDGEPTLETADIDTYDKAPEELVKKNSKLQYTPWYSHKPDMIKKCAEHKALKKAFGFSSLQNEDDFYIKNGVAYPASKAEQIETQDAKYEDLSKEVEKQ